MSGAAIVVLAGGVGARVGAGINKTLLKLEGVPVIARAVRTALDAQPSRVVVVVRPEDRDQLSQAIESVLACEGADGAGAADEVWVVDGGVERHDSEWLALQALEPCIESGEIDVVAIHDAARPLAPVTLYRDVVRAARTHGGAIPTVRMDHLIGGGGSVHVEHESVVAVQTPQAFRASALLSAYRQADAAAFRGTDTASCIERFSDLSIVGVPSSTTNLKVTYAEDLAVAEQLLLQR